MSGLKLLEGLRQGGSQHVSFVQGSGKIGVSKFFSL